MTVEDIIRRAGSQTKLARGIGASQQSVWKWLHGSNQIPAAHVIPTCKFLSWEITPHQVRPDIYPSPDDGLPVSLRGAHAPAANDPGHQTAISQASGQ